MLKEWKDKPQDKKKYSQITKASNPEYIRTFQLNNEKTNYPVKKWVKELKKKDTLPKSYTDGKQANKILKIISH